jgi:predicted nucleic acid-binding protein
MKPSIISDSACLIGLERIQSLDILPGLFDPVVIPPEVQQEFGTVLPWLHVEIPSNPGFIASLKLMVDDGEAEAIALAYEKGWRIILDDRHARKIAVRLGVTMIGTVGILVKAKRHGHITAVKPLIEQLEKHNFYISEALKQEALRLAGE